MELAHQLKKRFTFDNPKYYKALGQFDPSKAVSGTVSSLVGALKEFPMFEADMVCINEKYRLVIVSWKR